MCFVVFCSVVFGEDVAFGGVFRCTVGLKDKYGLFGISVLFFKQLSLNDYKC